ncbi:aldehyde dehydrogenase family protein, partial [Staphylococcus epidermidis]|uniref:aldehyde dehydrogenase family protein n=1 Tax=Staphylococcus epidermidis TaxID=1282 RepID=UPI0011A9A1CF
KPSQETPFPPIILPQIFDKVPLPKGVFNLLNPHPSPLPNPLTQHPKLTIISFTPSAPTASKIIQKAPKHFKKVSLQLRAKSPYIVL